MKILHIEASPGWGGQELRILREAEGMRARGHEVILVVQEGGGLVEQARNSGFEVYEMPFTKSKALWVLYRLIRLICQKKIDVVTTHSSMDAWLGGLAGKLCRRRVIRTRHLSTAIRPGMNSYLLYNFLADYVVTTCEDAAVAIRRQANLSSQRCFSIPTGVDPTSIIYQQEEVARFRESHGVAPHECLAGTLCVLRGWKGISHFLQAAKLLEHVPHLKWMVVGSGVSEELFHQEWRALGLEQKVIFTGHLSPPFTALAAMDIFCLLSWAHEGVSQASLQASWLKKPLVTTSIGGLSEVCIHGKTGFQVPTYAPQAVAQAVLSLAENSQLRCRMGEAAKNLVEEKFTLTHTLDQMETLYTKRPYDPLWKPKSC